MVSKDNETRLALAFIAAVVTLASFGILAFAIGRSGQNQSPPSLSGAPGYETNDPTPRLDEVFGMLHAIDFVSDSDLLPPDSDLILRSVAEVARNHQGITVFISSPAYASHPERSADLAQRRVSAVRHALEANGVPPDQLVTAQPTRPVDRLSGRQAQRVEIRLR